MNIFGEFAKLAADGVKQLIEAPGAIMDALEDAWDDEEDN